MDVNANDYITRSTSLDENSEVAMLDGVLVGGYDQGCFLRPDLAGMLPLDLATATAVFDALNARGLIPEASQADPFEQTASASTAITGAEPGFVVLTQRCDLVRALATEPFVELAYTEFVTDTGIISAAKKNSGRLIHVADGEGGAWVADLRRRAILAKDCLPSCPVIQPLVDERARKRFKLRIGQRYSRDALPNDIAAGLQRPLLDVLRKKPAHMQLVDIFSEFLVFRAGENDELVEVIALYPPGADQHQAEEAWEQLEGLLPQAVVDYIVETSGALSMEQLNFYRYFYGWKLDLDDVSYHRKAGPNQTPPTV